MMLEEAELRFLLSDNNNNKILKYKNIIEFLLNNKERGIELPRIVNITDNVYHTMYLDERKRRDNIKTLAKEKLALVDREKYLFASK